MRYEESGASRIKDQLFQNCAVVRVLDAWYVFKHEPIGIALDDESRELLHKIAAFIGLDRRRRFGFRRLLTLCARTAICSVVTPLGPVSCLGKRLTGGAA